MTGSLARTAIFLFIGLAAGFAASAWWSRGGTVDATAPQDPALASRVAMLESSLARESRQRAALEAEMGRLEARIAALGGAPDGVDTAPAATPEPSAAVAPSPDEFAPPGRPEGFRDRGADAELWRRDRLIEAGFAPARADWINRRTAELRMEAMQDAYRAARAGEAAPRERRGADDALRAELGDDEYERYLTAIGRPTRVGVSSVLASSPAEQAGFLPGDEIVGYDGRRVFDARELNRLTLEGEAGETVAVDVLREGQPIQLYVPRGPIGVVGGRFGRRP